MSMPNIRQFAQRALNRPRCFAISVLVSISFMPPEIRGSPKPDGYQSGRQGIAARGDVKGDLLASEKSVQREISSGQVHIYKLKVEASQYLRVIVVQERIDLVVAFDSPGGELLVEADGPGGMNGPETLHAVSLAEGEHSLRVYPVDPKPAPGRYRIWLDEFRAAVPDDHLRVAALKLYLEAERIRVVTLKESKKKAIQLLNESIQLWQRAGDQYGEAQSQYSIGLAYSALRDWTMSLQHHTRALELWRILNDKPWENLTLRAMGVVHFASGDRKVGLEHYAQALDRAKGDPTSEAGTLNDIGWIYNKSADYPKAVNYFLQALRRAREAGDAQTEATTLNNIGLTYRTTGDYQKALDYLSETEALKKKLNDTLGEATALVNAGSAHILIGDWNNALDCFQRALPTFREFSQVSREAGTLSAIGWLYLKLGEYEKSIDYSERALSLSRDSTDSSIPAQALNGLGHAAIRLGRTQEAVAHFEEVLQFCTKSGNPICTANALNNLGLAHYERGKYREALGYFAQARSVKRQVAEPALEAEILYRTARVERNLGRLSAARSLLESALVITESLRDRLAGNSSRQSYSASIQTYYAAYIDVLMRMHRAHPALGYQKTAFRVSERARARTLLENLSHSLTEIEKGVDPALLERKWQITRDLNYRTELQVRALTGEAVTENIEELKKEIASLTSDLQALQTKIRQSSPSYAALTEPQPLSVEEIQKEVLDDDTVLLEYFLGDEASYLWVLSKARVYSFRLPRREHIERIAREVYGSLIARNEERDFEDGIRKESRVRRSDLEYAQAAGRLSDLILGPAFPLLRGKQRLLIISDGALQYIPFSALPVPGPPARRSTRGTYNIGRQPPLIVHHEIVSAPSASALPILRKDYEARRRATKTVAVLADPVFDRIDPRVDANAAKQPIGQSIVRNMALRSAAESGVAVEGRAIRRLPFSAQEAAAILSLVPPRESKKALGFDANRSTALSPELGQYRFVHFATHSLLNSAHPDLSGIVLSLVDPDGRDQDGFLRAYEIFNLDLPAEMVVLSACSTGLGKDIKGEGLVGLTRAFMYAGAARVVVSLWDVDDQSTAELMARMYKGIFGPKRLQPLAALRAAQLEMWKDQRWRAPYYWSAFTMQGEWK